MIAHHDPCGLAQRTRPPVVPEPRPGGQDLGFATGRQGLEARKAGNESLVKWGCGRHLRLLQHDLGDPDTVGVGGLAPRHLTAIPPIPFHEPTAQRDGVGPRPSIAGPFFAEPGRHDGS